MTTVDSTNLRELGWRIRRWLLDSPDRLMSLQSALSDRDGVLADAIADVRRHHRDFDLAGLCGLAVLAVARRLRRVDTARYGTFMGKPHAWSVIHGRILDVTVRQFSRGFPAVLIASQRSAFARRYRTTLRGEAAIAHVAEWDYEAGERELAKITRFAPGWSEA